MNTTSTSNDTPVSTAMSSTLAQQLSLAEKVNIAIFSLLLMATLVLGGLLQLFYIRRPEQQLNVLVRLQACSEQLVLPLNVALTLPVLWHLVTRQHWHILTAEAVSFVISLLASQIVILTVARSVTKLLLVTHFSWVFSQDPRQLTCLILSVTTILAFLPNLAYNLWLLWAQGRSNNNTVSYLVGSTEHQVGINFGRTYVLVWLLISLVMACLVVFWIPVYLKKAHNADSIRDIEKHTYPCYVKHCDTSLRVLRGTRAIAWNFPCNSWLLSEVQSKNQQKPAIAQKSPCYTVARVPCGTPRLLSQ